MNLGALGDESPATISARSWTKTERLGSSVFIPFITAALIVWGFVDAPRAAHVGRVSVSAIITILTSLITAGLAGVFFERARLRFGYWAVPLVALVLTATAVLTVQWRAQGAENVLVYASLVALIAIAAVFNCEIRAKRRLVAGALVAVALSDILYMATVIQHGAGQPGIVSPRAFAALALLSLAFGLGLRYIRLRLGLIIAAVQLALIAVSLSRTATLAAMIVVAASFLQRSWRRNAVVLILLAFALFFVVALSQASQTLHERASGGDQAFHVAGLTINTEGRYVYWRIAWDYFTTSPVIGHGPGSASTNIVRYYPKIDHPHNDYLRLLDDGGLIALLVVLGYFALGMVILWRRWQHATERNVHREATAAMAFLGMLGVALLMTTDNVIVYDYVMAPLGLVIGLAVRRDAEPRLRENSLQMNRHRPPSSGVTLRMPNRSA